MKKVCVFILILIVLTSPVFSVCPIGEELWAPAAIGAVPMVPLIAASVPALTVVGAIALAITDGNGSTNYYTTLGSIAEGTLPFLAVSMPIGMVSGMVLNATCVDPKTLSFGSVLSDIGISLLYGGYGAASGALIVSQVSSDATASGLGMIIGAIAGFIPTLVIEILQY